MLDIEKSKNVITPTNMFQKKMTALLNDEGEHTEKSGAVTDTVLKCLITSNKPMSIKQISESTGLVI